MMDSQTLMASSNLQGQVFDDVHILITSNYGCNVGLSC
jgi:hypothetical protein